MAFDDAFVDLIIDELSDGWGVEDIAVRHGVLVADVRAVVRELDGTGALALLYKLEDFNV